MSNLQSLYGLLMQMGYKHVRIEAIDADGKKHSLEYNQHNSNPTPERAQRAKNVPGLE